MANKTFKTHRDQLVILRNRGMIIKKGSQESRVIKLLEKENYYSVINGYKDPFIIAGVTPESFQSGTSFDELFALFSFDRNIRLIYLKFILKIEHQIKTVIAHEFSRLYGHDNYLKLDNFDNSTSKKIKEILDLFRHIQSNLSDQMGRSNEITHYMSVYGYIPLWVLVNILSLGEMSYFYANMKPHDQNEVARHFGVLPVDLAKYIKNLTLARNLCAHDERFYDFVYKSSLSTTHIPNFSIFAIPVRHGNCLYGTNDTFSIAVILSILLSKKDVREFVSSLKKEFTKLNSLLTTISANIIFQKMGFGPHWEKLTQL